MYIRLSTESTAYRGEESMSIENQKAILSKFIAMMPGWVEKRMYIDNGATGGNFNRKGFQDMMEDVRSGVINLVLVKDLSRFGRNYLESGKYLEEIFPSLGCRFVALDDGVDTETGENDIVSFYNAMNDFYLKNISDRIKNNPVPRFRPLHFTAKPAPLARRLSLAFAGLRAPRPRPHPKNRIGRTHNGLIHNEYIFHFQI